MSTDARPDGVTLVDSAAFVAELVLLAALAVAGVRLGGSTPVDVVLAVGLPLSAAAVWGTLLAPRAARRLRYPIRTIVKVDLFTAAAVLLGVSGLVTEAIAFWVLTVALVVAAEVADHRRETPTNP